MSVHQEPRPPERAHGPEAARSLARIVEDLSLPLPARTRLLQELASDLHDFTDSLVTRGVPWHEARRRAAETVVPDASALSEIEGLLVPRYRKLTGGLSANALRRSERAALAIATLILVSLQTSALLKAELLADPSPFLWPVLATGAATLALVLAKAFQLWIKGQHQRPRRALGLVAGLSGATLCLAIGGVLVDLIRLCAAMEQSPSDGPALVTAWIVRDAALLSSGILLALTGALGWFALSAWITHVEHRHRRALDHDIHLHITERDT